MVETIESISSSDKISENFNVPVIFVENRDDEVNGHMINGSNSDHYSPSVRVVHVSKPVDTTSSFGFHLSRSKWDPYPYISRVDKDSFASSSGLREGDCVLEVSSVNKSVIKLENIRDKISRRQI
jgi:PDZ domain